MRARETEGGRQREIGRERDRGREGRREGGREGGREGDGLAGWIRNAWIPLVTMHFRRAYDRYNFFHAMKNQENKEV